MSRCSLPSSTPSEKSNPYKYPSITWLKRKEDSPSYSSMRKTRPSQPSIIMTRQNSWSVPFGWESQSLRTRSLITTRPSGEMISICKNCSRKRCRTRDIRCNCSREIKLWDCQSSRTPRKNRCQSPSCLFKKTIDHYLYSYNSFTSNHHLSSRFCQLRFYFS